MTRLYMLPVAFLLLLGIGPVVGQDKLDIVIEPPSTQGPSFDIKDSGDRHLPVTEKAAADAAKTETKTIIQDTRPVTGNPSVKK